MITFLFAIGKNIILIRICVRQIFEISEIERILN